MEKVKSILIAGKQHRKLKLYSVKQNIPIKLLVEEWIDSITKGGHNEQHALQNQADRRLDLAERS